MALFTGWDLQTRTLAAMLLVGAAVPIVGGALGLVRVGDALEEQVNDGQIAASRSAASEVALGMEFAVESVRSLARRSSFRALVANGENDQVREVLDNAYTTTPLFHALGVSGSEGEVVISVPGPLMTPTDEAVGDGAPMTLPARPVGEDAILLVREPVISEGGQVVGILIGEISFNKTVPGLAGLTFGETGSATLIDTRGQVLVTGEPLRVGRILETPAQRSLIAAWREDTASYHSSILDREEIIAFVPVPRHEWAVIVSQAREEIFEPVTSLRNGLIAGIVILVLLGLALAIAVSRSVGRYEERFREGEEKFRAVSENSGDAIVSADQDGNILYMNPGAERLFGYGDEEARGQPLTILMPPRHHAAHEAGLRRYLDTREPRVIGGSVELEGRRRDGSEFPLELSLGSWETRGKTYFVGAIREITDRRASEEALERHAAELRLANEELERLNAATREFVAVASHDLRGPLTSILGFSGLLEQKWDQTPESQRVSFIQIISRQSQRISRLVDDLLTVSRIDAGALDTHAEVLRLTDVMEGAMESFREHTAEIEFRGVDSLAVKADRDHMNRILTNLLTNAVKYGEPPIEVEAKSEDGWVEVRVRDCGEGVPQEFVPRLFERFARGDTTGTRKQKGTGLGLSIVRGLANANGGEAWYEPNQPKGSCFGVRIPRAPDDGG